MRLLLQHAMVGEVVLKELYVIVQTVFVGFLHDGAKRLQWERARIGTMSE